MSSIQSIAMQRYRRLLHPSRSKCERVLVNEDLQERVSERARAVAEWIGEAKTQGLTSLDPILQNLKALVNETRAAYTVSRELTEERLEQLTDAIAENRATVEGEIQRAKNPQPALPRKVEASSEPNMYRARESHDWGMQWPPNSNDKP